MSERYGPVVAWVLFAVALAALGGAVLLGVGNAAVVGGSMVGLGPLSMLELLWVLAWLGFGVVGVFLIQRRPAGPVGWILLGIPTLTYVTLFLAEYAVRGLVVQPGSLPFALTVGWVSKWSFVPVVGLLLWLVLLFPDEQVEGRWMRRLAVAVTALIGLQAVIIAVEPMPIRGDIDVMNPIALTSLGAAPVVAANVVGTAIALLGVATIVDAVRRWRRSEGIRRQQFKWFAFAVGSFPLLFVATVVISDTVGADWGWDPVVLAFFFALNGAAAAIGVAVTRYRLYEIDRVVNRAVVYTVLTATLIGAYALSVIGLQRLLSPVTSGSDLAVAASTLAVAAAFGPLRGRVQRFVDRRFDREHFDASRTVEVFGQRLRDEVDLVNLTDELRHVAQRVVRPSLLTVWLRDGEATR
jgi:hypothetical protein